MAHPDLDDVRESYDLSAGSIDRVVENALDDTSELGRVRAGAFALAAFAHHLGRRVEVPKWLRLGLEASIAILASVQAPGEAVTYTLAGRRATRPGNTSTVEAGIDRWELMLFGAIILGDAKILQIVASAPRAVVVTTRIAGLEIHYDWYDVLASLGSGAPVDATILARARATDPATQMKHIQKLASEIYLPTFDAIHHLVAGDAVALQKAFAVALKKHAKHGSAKSRMRDPDGYVSWPLSALAVLAKKRGVAIDVESSYLLRLAA